ncbi:neurotransmitter:Na+ symporter, NSS family [Granulicatella balaenopterae]|uniref:Neurotransmitter:Na+ symporter, NSS family n=1 Tax=Granulicatella balaenopterae TaxID=137733 RepID=A0A1H9NNC9_9LACT|nr:sodium-dependent transporter [Granulicatella balaenopterae]SER37149.1 neurotransmitter:Na+ symporter, NSS family [Granulicatella balaenopterae]
MDEQLTKGKFNTNFGFLMAAIGSAVGLGNLWGFPYKMGEGGGFAFLLMYIVLAIVIGYSCMVAELALGRKSGKGAIGAYRAIDSKFQFNGWLACLSPLFLLMFYCALGGYCIKYLVANFGNIFGANWGIHSTDSQTYFLNFVSNTGEAMIFAIIFLVLTIVIVSLGVAKGLEKFSVTAMPILFVMLLIVVVRSVTLPGASEGIRFMFTPNWQIFHGLGWVKVLAAAGGQLFFSLSLSSGCLIAFSSYLDKKENLERNALIIPLADTMVALLAGLATIPAVFSAGLEPTQGPGMLFITLQTVFQGMGKAGPLFGTAFYFLVFLAALSSSIAMMEGAVSTFIDRRIEAGKEANRPLVTTVIGAIGCVGCLIVTFDALGSSDLPHLFGFSTWIDTFDLFAEGLLMPMNAFIMTIILGWLRPDYIDDEIELSSSYHSKPFVSICLKYIAPLFMLLILVGQLDNFFQLGIF